MVAFAAGAVGVVIGKQLVDRTPAPPAVPSHQEIDVSTRHGDLPRIDVAAVSEAVGPSVVTISADVDVDAGAGAGESIGTGIITTSDGEIVTNAHVVAEASKIRVRLAGETEPRDATLLADRRRQRPRPAAHRRLRIPGGTFCRSELDRHRRRGGGDRLRARPRRPAVGHARHRVGTRSHGDDRERRARRTRSRPMLRSRRVTPEAHSSTRAGEVVGINTVVVKGGAATAATNVGLAISNAEALPVIASLRQHSAGDQRAEGYIGVGLGRPRRWRSWRGRDERRFRRAGRRRRRPGRRHRDRGRRLGHRGQAGLVSAIRDRQPGDEVALVVLRGGDIHTLEVVLTTRPES